MGDYRIIIADDHHLFRAGLKGIIDGKAGLKVVAEAVNGDDLVKKAAAVEADLVITDLSMPGLHGLEAAKELRRKHPDLKIIVLSMHKEAEFFRRALAMGIDGYLLKTDIFEKVLSAIQMVKSGAKVFSDDLTGKLAEDYTALRESEVSLELLTRRERQILRLIAQGWKNREISEELDISIRTVETHRSNLMQKLDLENIQDLIKFAVQKGLT